MAEWYMLLECADVSALFAAVTRFDKLTTGVTAEQSGDASPHSIKLLGALGAKARLNVGFQEPSKNVICLGGDGRNGFP